jgi:hypothetical protein
MRPSVSGPTGTVMASPVSTYFLPRTRPSVLSIAMAAHGAFAEMLRDFENQLLAIIARFPARSEWPDSPHQTVRRRQRREPGYPTFCPAAPFGSLPFYFSFK